ncbi:hypothetical protein C8R45DRAFT_1096827 [Mycena sanguinolenta]|nr:hypothetical protein C8R45DRAFT_1096827 [Mycena sanguinolenta]
MGRRAIYLDTDQRTAGKRARDLRYSRSARGKEVHAACREQQHRWKPACRYTRITPPHIPGIATLSARIHSLAAVALPETEMLYWDALRRSDVLDLSDIARWKKQPPFEEDDDPADPGYLRFTHNLGIVLHGVRMREENEQDIVHRQEFQAGATAAMGRLWAEVVGLLACWERGEELRAQNIYHLFRQSRELAMLDHWLQWQACTIYRLYYLRFLEQVSLS